MSRLSLMVSVVIPVYNGEKYLAEAIESVLAQTYRPLECIVVDDGSTDRTPEIAARFGSSVRYLRQDNSGVASARNLGAARAEGPYLAFLDADDVWRPDKLQQQMSVLTADTSVGLVYSGVDIVDGRLHRLGALLPASPAVALRNTLLLELPIITAFGSTAVMPREVFLALGGFDECLTTSADCDLSCRIAARYRVACLSTSLAQYRQHSSQMHLNLRALEHDMLIVYAKLFGTGVLPEDVDRLRHRAYANLYMTLAAAYLKRRRWRDGTRCVLCALRHHPLRLLAGARDLLAKRLSSGSTAGS